WIERMAGSLRRAVPAPFTDVVYARIVRFFITYGLTTLITGAVLLVIYYQRAGQGADPALVASLLWTVFGVLLAISVFAAWYILLTRESQRAAEDESERQTVMLIDEIEAHARTDTELQRAKEAADAANLAK